MKYTLVDVENEVERDVQFGSCDLCYHLGTHYYDNLIFQDENGQKYRVENGEWSWGSYMEIWDIDNYVAFAAFIKDKDYPTPQLDHYGELEFESVVHEMYLQYEEATS